MYIDFDDQPPYYDEISDISEKPIATFSSSSGLLEVFFVFWISPLGPISLGGIDVTVGICGRRYDRNSLVYEKLL